MGLVKVLQRKLALNRPGLVQEAAVIPCHRRAVQALLQFHLGMPAKRPFARLDCLADSFLGLERAEHGDQSLGWRLTRTNHGRTG